VRARIGIGVWLAVVWVVLWGEVTFANAVTGIVMGAAIVLALPPARRPRTLVLRPWATTRFLAVFAWKLVEASAVVAWEVVTPRNRIKEGIVAIPIVSESDVVTAIVADAISLTPGSLTIEVDADHGVLYVHVLHLHDVEEVRADVRRLEDLAIAAFAPSGGGGGHDAPASSAGEEETP